MSSLRLRLAQGLGGLALASGAGLLLCSPDAQAYPAMIRHGYTGCGECHTDPSGGGVLTEYGRGVGVLLMSSVWQERAPDWEPGPAKDFLFGAIPLPEQLALQADLRAIVIPEPGDVRVISMQNDLRGHVELGPIHANGSLGWVSEGAEKAWITGNTGKGGNLVSREHWVGVEPVDGLLIRGGSMNLPFGIRSEEHMLFARSATRTTTNDDQQLGLDAIWETDKVKVEAMGIAGDFQVSPDDYRERGYSASLGWGVDTALELGASSKLTHSTLDLETRQPRTLQAHELFARYSPTDRLALLSEAGLLLDQNGTGASTTLGSFGYLQGDLELVQGLNLKAQGEWCDNDLGGAPGSVGRGWLALQWFAVAHLDLRADAMYGTLYCTPGTDPSFMGMVQAHAYL